MKQNNYCRFAVFALVPLVVVVFAGCPKSGPARPKTVAVTGKVTYNGQAVEGATVTFVSRQGTNSAVGLTDATGQYKLTTFAKDDGAVPGEYQVKIIKTEAPPAAGPAVSDEDPNYVPPEEMGPEPAAPKNLLPAKYADPNSSGLSATVTESAAKNVFDFQLVD